MVQAADSRFESGRDTYYLLIALATRCAAVRGHQLRLAGRARNSAEAIQGANRNSGPHSYTAPSISARLPIGCARAIRTGVSGFGVRI